MLLQISYDSELELNKLKVQENVALSNIILSESLFGIVCLLACSS